MGDFLGVLGHEWMKIWINRKFLLYLGCMLVLNMGMLCYSTITYDEGTDLSTYTKLITTIETLNDNEKIIYLENHLNKIKEEEIALDPGERTLLNEVLNEVQTVVNYPVYLENIQNQAANLVDISIFEQSNRNEYSTKNIEKTAADYKAMQEINPTFQSGKAIELATGFSQTDSLIILVICVIVYLSIFYEKEKKLQSIIYPSLNGGNSTGISKVIAFQLSCIILTLLFYGGNLVYCLINFPLPDFSEALQGVALLSTSTLKVSLGTYLTIYLLSKSLVIIIIGNLMLLFATLTQYIFIPYLITGTVLITSYMMWIQIHPTSIWGLFKYINLVALLDVNKVFGSYKNLNVLNEPISYHKLWITITFILLIILNIAIVLGYSMIKNRNVKPLKFNLKRFTPHNHLFVHEAYKILMMKKGIIILFLFVIATGYVYSNHTYYVSNYEDVYHRYIKQLEGPISDDKEEFLKNEKEKYEKALQKSDEIDELVFNNEITLLESMYLKEEPNRILSHYSVFERVWDKYEFIKQNKEAEFTYDTAYRIMFSTQDPTLPISIVLYFVTMIFTLSIVFPMEYSQSQYNLLHPTKIGVKKIETIKILISSVIALIIMGITIGSRLYHISKYYEFSNIGAKSISLYGAKFWGSELPIVVIWLLIVSVLLLFSLIFMGMILTISKKVKNSVYTMVIASVIVAIGSYIFSIISV